MSTGEIIDRAVKFYGPVLLAIIGLVAIFCGIWWWLDQKFDAAHRISESNGWCVDGAGEPQLRPERRTS